jgi:hypothetical protein
LVREVDGPQPVRPTDQRDDRTVQRPEADVGALPRRGDAGRGHVVAQCLDTADAVGVGLQPDAHAGRVHEQVARGGLERLTDRRRVLDRESQRSQQRDVLPRRDPETEVGAAQLDRADLQHPGEHDVLDQHVVREERLDREADATSDRGGVAAQLLDDVAEPADPGRADDGHVDQHPGLSRKVKEVSSRIKFRERPHRRLET